MKISTTHSPVPLESKQTAKEQKAAIKEAAQKFEAFMTSQLFKQVARVSEEVGNTTSLAESFFHENLAVHTAEVSASKGELGLAKVLEKAWTPASLTELQELRGEQKRIENEFLPKDSFTRADDRSEDNDSERDP